MFSKAFSIRIPVIRSLCQCTLVAALAGMVVDGLVCIAIGWPELLDSHGAFGGDALFALAGRLLGALACAAVLHVGLRSTSRSLGHPRGEQRWRFAADVSHELRTPLAALKIIGENALARPRDQGDPRETIATMLEECERMAEVINGLLTLERVDRTGRQLELTCVDLGSLVREAVQSLQVLAEDRQHIVRTAVVSTAQARAHPVLVRQALLNVIHNAIRHCPDGSRIEVRVVSRSYGWLLVQVHDNGRGIPLGAQMRIFERFERGGGSQRCGLGLGLAIAKASLEAQGGSIRLLRSGAHGSCFEIELPQWQPSAAVTQSADPICARSVWLKSWRPAAQVSDARGRL